MICSICNTNNNDTSPFCSVCGSPLGKSTRVCTNGHVYDSSLSKCPFCPSTELRGLMGQSGGSFSDKTIIGNTGSGGSDKTMISGQSNSFSSSANKGTGTDKTIISFVNQGSANDKTMISSNAVKGDDNVSKKDNDPVFSQPETKTQPRDRQTIITKSPGQRPDGNAVPSRKITGWLITYTWNANGNDYRLFEGRNTLGSNPSADVCLDDPALSSNHCLILFRNGKIKIKDELSTNGTFINGAEIEESVLNDGDMIKIGSTEFRFRSV